MSCKDLLLRKGWFLKDEFIEDCNSNTDAKKPAVETVIQKALNEDLREISSRSSCKTQTSGSSGEIEGPLILQIQKIKNVLAPARDEESTNHGAPSGRKFLGKIFLTDGAQSFQAVALKSIPSIHDNTPPGTKLRLVGKVPIFQGFLLLSKSNVEVLGGKVEKMIESWQVKKSLVGFERIHQQQEGGPPPFISFKNLKSRPSNVRQDEFKSLESKTNVSKETRENKEFEQQRKATIQAAMMEKNKKEKEGAHGRKVSTDEHLAALLQMGFSLDDSKKAVDKSSGNLYTAINYLISSSG